MATLSLRQELGTVSTVVVKVGSRLLIAEENVPHVKRVRTLVDNIAHLLKAGVRVLLVSSGAIAYGMRPFAFPGGRPPFPENRRAPA